MEAVVLLGLVGAGYLFNKGNENNNPINNAVNKEISDPSGDNLYNLDADIFCPCAIGAIINDETIKNR